MTTSTAFTKFEHALLSGQIDLDTDTLKVMLLSSYTPAYQTHQYVSDVKAAGAEISVTGYTAGGATLTSVTITDTGDVSYVSSANPTWTFVGGVTITDAVFYSTRGGTDATNPIICHWNLGGAITPSGSFSLTMPSTGFVSLGSTPSTGGTPGGGGGGTGGGGGSTPVAPTAGIVPSFTVLCTDSGTGDLWPQFSAGWTAAQNVGDTGGTDYYTDSAGAVMSITFTTGHDAGGVGGSVEVLGSQASHHGILGNKLDGVDLTGIDEYKPDPRVDGVSLFKSQPLADGTHTYVLSRTGLQNAASGGTTVAVNALKFTNVIDRTAPVIPPGGGGGGTAAITLNPANTRLLIRGSDTSLQFTGYNFGIGIFCASPPRGFTTSQFSDVFGQMRSDGHGLVRQWCFPKMNNPGGLASLDAYVAAAKAQNITIIFTLSDSLNSCGDSSTNGWSGWLGGGWNGAGNIGPWIDVVVPRYANEPHVMWEWCNEPSNDGNLISGATAINARIKSHTSQLTWSGSQPPYAYGSGGDANGYAKWKQLNGIFHGASMHAYDNGQYPSNHYYGDDHVHGAIEGANDNAQPLLIGEYGISKNFAAKGASRAASITSTLSSYIVGTDATSGLSNSGCVGALYWSVVNFDDGTLDYEFVPGSPEWNAIKNFSVPA